MTKAWYAAVRAVKDAKHFIAMADDGRPDWRRCFFGETLQAYEKAVADYEAILPLYKAKEAELNTWAKKNKRNKKPPIWRRWGKRSGMPR